MKELRKISDTGFLFIGIMGIILYAIGFLQGKYFNNEVTCIITIIATLFYLLFQTYINQKDG